MHNTSEQFYKYISQTIINYLTQRQLEGGERFNLYIEQAEDVDMLYKSIKQEYQPKINTFSYKHEKGKETFETYTVHIEDSDLIVVASNDTLKEDFITTLRNKVAKQEDSFEKKNLLILFSGRLDSLLGGSESFLKEGMPLNGKEFRINLENEITGSSSLQPYEKAILNYQLQEMEVYGNTDTQSIFDYTGIVSAIYKGQIEKPDYREIGLFPHQELQSITDEKSLESNIKENNELFKQIELIFNHGDPSNDLESIVSEKGAKEINAEDTIWSEIDFSNIIGWKEDRENLEPITFVGEAPYECNLDNSYVFGRADGYRAKKRNTNIILFNPMGIYPISLSLKFSRNVGKDSIKTDKTDSGLTISTFGSRINIEVNEADDNYRWFQYYDNASKKNFTFKILIYKCNPHYLESIRREFIIDKKKKCFELKHGDKPLIFNKEAPEKQTEILEEGATFDILNAETALQLNIKDDYEAEKTTFSLRIEEEVIPFNLITEKPTLKPITGLALWKNKRELNKNYYLEITSKDTDDETIKVLSDSEEYTVSGDLRQKLKWENQLIESDAMSWSIDLENKLVDTELNHIPERLTSAYHRLLQEYRTNKRIPSLTPLTGIYLELSEQYIRVFLDVIAEINDNEVSESVHSLAKLGLVCEAHHHKDIFVSPLHPLMLAYQIALNQEVGSEGLYDAILKRLNPINLMPFLKWGNDAIYSPTEDSSAPEWMKYNNKKVFKKGISKEFVRKLVKDKLDEFQNHFSYLFIKPQAPIIINLFNLGDCKEVLQGLFDFYEKRLKTTKKIDKLPCIDVNIYGSDKWVTKFEELTFYQNAKELADKDTELKLHIQKTSQYDADDLLNAFRRNVHFYTKSEDNISYAHISFFHFDQEKIGYSENVMENVPTGMALNGLFSDLTSEYNNQSYRTGFSTKGLKGEKTLLQKTAIACNAVGRVVMTNDLYEQDKALCSTVDFNTKASLENIYAKSQWVTFIEPRVGLNFFKENDNVIIIHYSDQYNNTSGYDAITVTKKTEQYQYVIKDFLTSKGLNDDKINTLETINLFNTINGDWLLKMVAQNNPNFKNEKLSILSAVKATLALYSHPDIVWIPTSLEEVLRVSGNAGLSKSDGLFSAKNLGKAGVHSDDLLLIGLEKSEDSLKMYLHPIEVKIGKNKPGVIKKAKEQVKNTARLLEESLIVEEDKSNFKTALHKNFFAKLALVTAEKLKLYQVWTKQNHQWDKVLYAYRDKLLNNEFEIDTLKEYIGTSSILLFGGDHFRRTIEKEDEELTIFRFMEEDGYNFLCEDIDVWCQEFIESENSINSDLLLGNQYNSLQASKVLAQANSDRPTPKIERTQPAIPNEKPMIEEVIESRPIEILFGHNVNSKKPVKWHPSTTSKVLHTNTGIIGTMGTGKTQFTKSLVTQLVQESKHNVDGKPIGILIFDYKGDYIGEDFVKATNAKVFDLYHLPYNPLAIDVYENAMNLLPLHTASTIKETIARAYGLGKKQEQALRSVIMQAYEEKGIDKANKDTWSNPAPTISDVCEIFMNDEKVAQDSLYAALDNLQQFEIFQPDTSKTQSLFDLLEGVLVINLSGYDESVQNLVVAITLDLFYSQMQKAGHSKIDADFRQLNKMVLVDEADNFLSKNFNSIRKILKEGREFGVGTILSTQFLSHFSTASNDYSTYILTWIVHRVNEIKRQEVDSLFKLETKEAALQLINEIKSLDKHYSIVNLAGSEPIFIKDRAFWELMRDANEQV